MVRPSEALRDAAQRFVSDHDDRQSFHSFWVPTHYFVEGKHQPNCAFCALRAALALVRQERKEDI